MPSSVIAGMRYDAGARVLTLVFRSGPGREAGRYRYFEVPPEVWEAFRAAPSKGTFLNEVFKGLGFRFERATKRGQGENG